MRKPKLKEVPPLELKERDVITQTRTYKLITPLFGGGVVAAETDPVTPIRGTEIRGHLRFWWRATRGGQFNGSLEDMKAFEDKLWGAAANTTKKSDRTEPVQIAVEIISDGQADSPFELVPNKRGQYQPRPRKGSVVPAYAAFPLQPTREEAIARAKPKTVQVGVEFRLTISYPKDKDMGKEVEAAVWAWETFGGIGARTRRGFGALQCTEVNGNTDTCLAPNSNQIEGQIKTKLKQYVATGNMHKDIPHLLPESAKFKVTEKQKDAPAAWNFLINRLRGFRQDRRGSKYGPSLWPEPNAIRSLAKKPTKGTPIEKFPRARFGLPILFHFPQERNLEDATLNGAGDVERFSSPLILRPLSCTDGAVGLALILAGPIGPPSDELELQIQGQKKPFPVDPLCQNK